MGLLTNKVTSILCAILILMAGVGSVYLILMVLSFKHNVLKLFEMLSHELIVLQENAAVSFLEFISTTD